MSQRRLACRSLIALILCLAYRDAFTLGEDAGPGARDVSGARRAREPVALALSPSGNRLVTANRRSGSLSVVDTTTREVLVEHQVGLGLVDVTPLPDGRHWLALDREGNALIVVALDDREARVVDHLTLKLDPVKMSWDRNCERGVVASLASRGLTFLERAPDSTRPRISRVVELPFPPRCLTWLPGTDQVVVADAYAGRLLVVNAGTGATGPVRAFPAQNVRGLAVSTRGDSVLLAYQELSPSATTDQEDVHWGRLLNNHLRTIRVESLLTAKTDQGLLEGSLTFDLGSFGNGAGDPAGIAVDEVGGVAVALSGVGEVSIGLNPTDMRHRTRVGARPLAVAFARDGREVFSVDALDDTVTVIALPHGLRRQTIALGPRPAPEAVARGERLFYDANLSHDRWMSCHTCHADGHTTGGLADTLGDGSYGAPKRIPSLLGVTQTGPWAWDGSVSRIEDQVRKSVETTMRGRELNDTEVADLATYLGTLTPKANPDDSAEVQRGRVVFESRKCARCHAPPSYTTPETYDVGLRDERGRRLFNPPSLLGVGLRAPLLHDGRAEDLTDVFLKIKHPRGAHWDSSEVADLVAFLKSL
ncbi:MAG: cytochrome c peroxidase [Isosphaeraceae bacterium]